MKDCMNQENPPLSATMNGIGSMYRALVALHGEVYPSNPAWFAAMAQGYVTQMRELLDDLEGLIEGVGPQTLQEPAARHSAKSVEEAAVLLEAA